jgi:hypothetical protein
MRLFLGLGIVALLAVGVWIAFAIGFLNWPIWID